MISNGFADLADGNPALAYQVIVDLLVGINDNDSVRRHLSASTQLLPRGSLRQSIKMTDRGPVIQPAGPASSGTEDDSESDIETSSKESAQQRGPIAEMLYSRWLEVSSSPLRTVQLLKKMSLRACAELPDCTDLEQYKSACLI